MPSSFPDDANCNIVLMDHINLVSIPNDGDSLSSNCHAVDAQDTSYNLQDHGTVSLYPPGGRTLHPVPPNPNG